MQNSKFYDNFEELENETYISNLFLDLVIKGNVKELYGGVNYISNILNKIDNQENLEGKEFRNVGEFFGVFRKKIYMYYSKIDELLAEKIKRYDQLAYLRDEIFQTFTQDGNIKDDATAELKKILEEVWQL